MSQHTLPPAEHTLRLAVYNSDFREYSKSEYRDYINYRYSDNSEYQRDITPLHIAVATGHYRSIKTLIELGADVSAIMYVENRKYSVLDYYLLKNQNQKKKIVVLLAKSDVSEDETDGSLREFNFESLFTYIRNYEIIRYILSNYIEEARRYVMKPGNWSFVARMDYLYIQRGLAQNINRYRVISRVLRETGLNFNKQTDLELVYFWYSRDIDTRTHKYFMKRFLACMTSVDNTNRSILRIACNVDVKKVNFLIVWYM